MSPVDLGAIQCAALRLQIDGRHDVKQRKLFQKFDPFQNRDAWNLRKPPYFAPVDGRGCGTRKQSGNRIKGVKLAQTAAHGRKRRLVFPQLRPMQSTPDSQGWR